MKYNIATGQIQWMLFWCSIFVDEKFLIVWILSLFLSSQEIKEEIEDEANKAMDKIHKIVKGFE